MGDGGAVGDGGASVGGSAVDVDVATAAGVSVAGVAVGSAVERFWVAQPLINITPTSISAKRYKSDIVREVALKKIVMEQQSYEL